MWHIEKFVKTKAPWLISKFITKHMFTQFTYLNMFSNLIWMQEQVKYVRHSWRLADGRGHIYVQLSYIG